MTDLLGYQNGGQGNQANAVKSMVSNKAPLLNSPGIVLANTLYYDTSSSSVNGCESLSYFGKDKVAFSAVQTTGTPNCNIPNVFFQGTTYIVAQFNASTILWPTEAQLGNYGYAGFAMHEGWGASGIQSITYYLGSSSVSNVDVSIESNIAMALAQCETQEKKSQMIRGMGEAMCAFMYTSGAGVIGPNNSVSNQPLCRARDSSILFARERGARIESASNIGANLYDPTLLQVVIPVAALPFVSMACLDARLHFDTRLLTQNINTRLNLKGVNYRVSGPSAFKLSIAEAFKTFSELNIQSSQFELSNKALSIREELLAAPDFSTGLPFQYPQSMNFATVVDQSKSNYSSGDIAFNCNVTSMMNADLTTIFISVRDQLDDFTGLPSAMSVSAASRYDSTQAYAGAASRQNPLHFLELTNLQLSLNGQILFRFDQDDYKKVTLQQYLGGQNAVCKEAFGSSNLSIGGTTSVAITPENMVVPYEINIYEINLSRLRAIVHESHMQNTPRFTNQTMNIQGTIKAVDGNAAALFTLYDPTVLTTVINSADQEIYPLSVVGGSSPQRTFTCHVTYLYNGTFLVGQDGGNSALITA